MDWRQYSQKPDDGQFEKIEGRLHKRATTRRVLTAVAVVAVGGTLLGVLWSRSNNENVQVAEVPIKEVVEHVELNQKSNVVAAPVAKSATVDSEPVQLVAEVQTEAPATPNTLPEAEGKPVDEEQVAQASTVQVEEPSERTPAPVVLPRQQSDDEAPATVPQQEDEPALATHPTKDGSGDSLLMHEDNLLWAANVLIPNDADEANRTFRVWTSSEVNNFVLTIYNRQGRKVFSSNDITTRWDGTRGGSPLPQGVYVWVARFRDTSGQVRQERGTVTLLR